MSQGVADVMKMISENEVKFVDFHRHARQGAARDRAHFAF